VHQGLSGFFHCFGPPDDRGVVGRHYADLQGGGIGQDRLEFRLAPLLHLFPEIIVLQWPESDGIGRSVSSSYELHSLSPDIFVFGFCPGTLTVKEKSRRE